LTLRKSLLHIFRARHFAGFLAATWGCMLGGSLLLVSLTVLVGLLGGSRYVAFLLEALFGGLVLGVYRHVASQVYVSRRIGGGAVVLMFARTLLLSMFMPLTIILALYEAWRDSDSAMSAKDTSQKHRRQPASLTAQIGRYYGRMAHIG